MSVCGPGSGWLPRDTVLEHATRLRERVVRGECPYPDAVMEANDALIAGLRESPSTDTAEIAATQRKAANTLESWGIGLGLAAVAATVGVGIFALACAPIPGNAVVAASGAVAARILFRMSARNTDAGVQRRSLADHLEAWSAYGSDAVPRVTPWRGAMNLGTLQAITHTFAEDVKSFPYAKEMAAEHDRLASFLARSPDRALGDVKQELVEASRRPVGRLLPWVGRAGQWVANAGWIGSAAALAAGQPWLAAGLFGGILAGTGLKIAAQHAASAGPNAVRTARALHYWEQAMAAAPPAAAEKLIFGGDPRPAEDATIERTGEDVHLGKVVVPVKRRHHPNPAPTAPAPPAAHATPGETRAAKP